MTPQAATPVGDYAKEASTYAREIMGRERVIQAELARRTGIGQSMLSRVLAGVRAMEMDQFSAIFVALGVDPGDAMAEVVRRVRGH